MRPGIDPFPDRVGIAEGPAYHLLLAGETLPIFLRGRSFATAAALFQFQDQQPTQQGGPFGGGSAAEEVLDARRRAGLPGFLEAAAGLDGTPRTGS